MSAANFANVNNNGNCNYNNASNSNGVRPDSLLSTNREGDVIRSPARRGEMTNPDAIYYGKYCYNGE